MSEASDQIQDWIRRAYREPEDKSLLDAPRFTRWNMEVAFRAGIEAARNAKPDDNG